MGITWKSTAPVVLNFLPVAEGVRQSGSCCQPCSGETRTTGEPLPVQPPPAAGGKQYVQHCIEDTIPPVCLHAQIGRSTRGITMVFPMVSLALNVFWCNLVYL